MYLKGSKSWKKIQRKIPKLSNYFQPIKNSIISSQGDETPEMSQVMQEVDQNTDDVNIIIYIIYHIKYTFLNF